MGILMDRLVTAAVSKSHSSMRTCVRSGRMTRPVRRGCEGYRVLVYGVPGVTV